ncbi:IQ motif, EF-hand binding site [Trema orientale]|uniref:IQ motif, EF-hand binding site n=1 Tax=Trema orientale TaxID=63057 RepID=A0A2P5FC15_TREOI|nr:IQ motif, EF-hand binding site [Trema orientale]
MAEAEGDDHVINIDALTSDIKRTVTDDSLVMSPQFSIFRVPTIFLSHKENVYPPKAFSIGPIHHDKQYLKPTEIIKQKYLLGFISRPPDPNPDSTLRILTEAICKIQKEVRGSLCRSSQSA